MTQESRTIQIMDTTLRDGEQTQGVSFSPDEKVNLAKTLLDSLRVDRIEVASARVSDGEKQAVTEINVWANQEGYPGQVEVLVGKTENLDLVQPDVTGPEVHAKTNCLDRFPMNFLVCSPVFLPNICLSPNFISVLGNLFPNRLRVLLTRMILGKLGEATTELDVLKDRRH